MHCHGITGLGPIAEQGREIEQRIAPRALIPIDQRNRPQPARIENQVVELEVIVQQRRRAIGYDMAIEPSPQLLPPAGPSPARLPPAPGAATRPQPARETHPDVPAHPSRALSYPPHEPTPACAPTSRITPPPVPPDRPATLRAPYVPADTREFGTVRPAPPGLRTGAGCAAQPATHRTTGSGSGVHAPCHAHPAATVQTADGAARPVRSRAG